MTGGWRGSSSNWNGLHTHPGCEISGCYYIDDAGCTSDADAFGGRLMLLPDAPQALSEHHMSTLRRVGGSTKLVQANAEAERLGADTEEAKAVAVPVFLRFDPLPGTLLIFPSFVPHFVFPLQLAAPITPEAAAFTDSSRRRLRISAAFNVGNTPCAQPS
jgi:hypothetical protein